LDTDVKNHENAGYGRAYSILTGRAGGLILSEMTEGVREFETWEIPVGNGLCAVPRNRLSRRNVTEGVPYRLEFLDTLT
jgi:hypothetical protein